MTIELTYLTLSLILAGSLWIPFIVGSTLLGRAITTRLSGRQNFGTCPPGSIAQIGRI